MANLDPLQLTDWRRTISALYAEIRANNQTSEQRKQMWEHFRQVKDQLFWNHPMTPLMPEQQSLTDTAPFFEYDSDYAVWGKFNTDVLQYTLDTQLAADGEFAYTRVAEIDFELKGEANLLNMYWIDGYGGALYLPFGDSTNGKETYGGGRYLYDAIKGADLGSNGDQILLDFNFAYNPSCAYNHLWSCPLPPAENKLLIPILAGEKSFPET